VARGYLFAHEVDQRNTTALITRCFLTTL